MSDILAAIRKEAERLAGRAKQAPAELKALFQQDSAQAKQLSDILTGRDKSPKGAKLKEDAINVAMDLNPVSGMLGVIRNAASKKLTPEIIERLEMFDRHRPFYETQAINAIQDSAKLAKALKVSSTLQKSPSLDTVDALIKKATELPTGNSNRSDLAIKELLSNYLLPARRRIEYNSLSPDEIMRNLQSRGILNESGQPAEDVVRVIRGQKSPYERLRTPVENFQNVLQPSEISNHAVFASKDAAEAANYSYTKATKARNPVSYPMYARIDESIFNSLNPEHINKVINKLSNNPGLSKSQITELSTQLDSLHAFQSQDWQKMESPAIQLAMKEAGFRGFLTDEAGRNSNVGMFDPSSFLSIFSHGKPGVSDIQSFLATAGLAGLVGTAASGSKDKPAVSD